jgi:hypothetical protein
VSFQFGWCFIYQLTARSLVIMPRDTDVWSVCMTPVPDRALWGLDIVTEIHQLAAKHNVKVDRLFLEQVRSLNPQTHVPMLPPLPLPPPDWDRTKDNAHTITWNIPFDSEHQYNIKPGFTSSSKSS